jgi:hypothetical protein
MDGCRHGRRWSHERASQEADVATDDAIHFCNATWASWAAAESCMPDYEWDLGRWERQVSTTATSAPEIGDDVADRLELKDPLTAQSRVRT